MEPNNAPNEFERRVDEMIGKLQAAKYFLGQSGTVCRMTVKPYSVRRLYCRTRLAYIMQQYGICQQLIFFIHQIEHHYRMLKNITFRMKLWRLFLSL